VGEAFYKKGVEAMTGYLERYQQGECVQVWKELAAAGDAVRAEPLYSAARAVAQETMRRAKQNVDLLVMRLRAIGYEFQFPEDVIQPPSPGLLADLDAFEREVGPVPLSLRAWVEVVGSVNLMGSYPRLSYYYDSSANPLFAMRGEDGEVETLDLDSMLQGTSSDYLPPELSNAFGKLRGMFQALQDMQGGERPERKAIAEEDQVESDPLVFEPMEIAVEVYEEWQDYEDDPFIATLAPDIFHKANVSGGDGIGMVLPNAAADAPLLNTEWGALTFVEYLRLSFEWAGFPGLQEYDRRDEALLSALKEGLLPL
jgi:hypothetical protein